MSTKKLNTEPEKEIKEHRSAWAKIQRVIREEEFRHGESLCATVMRLIRERNAVFAVVEKSKTRFME